MDLSFSPQYERLRSEVAAFVSEQWTLLFPKAQDKESHIWAFRKAATEAGYLLGHVPKKYGGSEQEFDPLKLMVIDQEFRKAGVITMPHDQAVGEMLLIPTLLQHGSEWQKDYFIPKTLRGELIWSQGYSEPNTGSDLLSLSTKAEQDGEEWVVNGQKLWSTNAGRADYMFALVKTHPEQRSSKSLSYLLIDMKTPGITARGINIMTGSEHFGEVFFDDARIPLQNTVGEPGSGWMVGNSTLATERNWVGSADALMDTYHSLIALAKRPSAIDGSIPIVDPIIQDKLLCIEGYATSHYLSKCHQLSRLVKGENTHPLPLFDKLSSTSLIEEMSRLAGDMMSTDIQQTPPHNSEPGVSIEDFWRYQNYWSLGNAIAGGASNIQRNIIAEKVLGLPRDQRG